MSLESKLKNALESNNEETISNVFEVIYNEYYHLVCFCILKYVHNEQDIEEIASDVFISFFNHLDKSIIRNIKYYLTITSKNISLNFLRNHHKIHPLQENNMIAYEDTQLEDTKNSCLKEILSNENYYLLYEHIINKRSLKEIACELKLPYETLKKRYNRLIKKIKKEKIIYE